MFYFRRLEESEKKRQAMMQAMKDQSKAKGPNFTITKKDLSVSSRMLSYRPRSDTMKLPSCKTRVILHRRNSSVTRRKSSWRRRRRFPSAFASSPWISMVCPSTNSALRPPNYGRLSLNLKPKSTIWRSDKSVRITM